MKKISISKWVAAVALMAVTSAFAAVSGNPVVNVGTLPVGKSVTIVFQTTITNPVPNGVFQLSSSGTVSGGNFSPVTAGPAVTPLFITPTFTSTNIATFLVGSANSFNVTANGSPAPGFTTTAPLPSGLTLTAGGLLSGTPVGGVYNFTLLATNAAGTNGQPFTLTVNEAPVVTATNTTFTVGSNGTYTVTATGFPAPALSESNTDILPGGVTFNPGTGILGGIPDVGSGGLYTLHFFATNTVGTATRAFLLTVNEAPTITSATNTTFTTGLVGAFNVTATGFPVPKIIETGILPSGVTLNPSTGVLGGTPATGSDGTYNITLSATNAAGTNTQNFTLTVNSQADLSAANNDSPDPVIAGNNLTYTINVNNSGPSAAQTVTLTNALPANTVLVSVSTPTGWARTDSTAVGANGTVTFSKPTVTNSETASFIVVVTVNSGTPDGFVITNDAVVASATTDQNPGNNTGSAATTVSSQADLSAGNSDSPDPVIAGDNLTYTINFANNGPSDAQAVTLSDALPSGTTFVSVTTPAGWTRTDSTAIGANGTITFTKGVLTAGASGGLTLVVKVDGSTADASTISDTVSVSSTTTDPNPGNNNPIVLTTVNSRADLSVSNTDSPDPVNAGSKLTNSLAFANNGSSDAQTVTVTDAMPTNTIFVSATVTNGSGWTVIAPALNATNGTIIFSNATVTAGSTANFEVVLKVATTAPDGSTITNIAVAASATPDPNAGNNTSTTTTLVANVPPTVGTPTVNPTTANEGASTAFTVNGTFSDPNGAAELPFTSVIDWGDGSTDTAVVSGSSNPFTNSFSGNHTYAQSGTYGVTISVTDKDGRTGTSAATTVTVANVAPSVGTPIVSPTTANEGSSTAFTVSGTFTDPAGALDQPFTAVVNWGDGSTDTAVVSGSSNPFTNSFSGNHTYAQSGTYNVTVSVTDKDGGTGTSAATTVTVANVAPSVGTPIVSPTTANEGSSTAFTVSGTFTDPAGALDQPFTAVVNWGDGSTDTAVVSGSSNPFTNSFSGNHTYAQSGTYNVTVSVTDKDGGTGTSAATTVTVANVAPSVGTPIVSPTTANEGSSTAFTVSGTFTDPAGALDQPFTAVVNWGDGSTDTAVVSGSSNPFTNSFSGNHTYAQSGTYNVTVSVTDKDGGTGTSAATTVTVANVAPSVGTPVVSPTTARLNSSTNFTVNGTFTDPAGALDQPFTAVVNWDDGSTDTAVVSGSSNPFNYSFSGNHTYTTPGNHNVTVSVTDKDGGTGTSAATSVNVIDTPVFTSAGNTTFTTGSNTTFIVTTTGFPAPALSESGTLPGGVTFIDNGDGTGSLSGTPAAGSGGIYNITFTAANIAGVTTQSFTLTVNQSPAITSIDTISFTATVADSFTVTATGFPVATLSESGVLPSGVNFTDNGNGTATLSGTAALHTEGTYNIVFAATNVAGGVTQNFTFIVKPSLAITSTNRTTFTVGSAGSFTVTDTGTPAPVLSESGAFPGGVTFDPSTGIVTGTPVSGSGGIYNIAFTATNITGSITQNFILTINEAPAITSDTNTTFTAGGSGSFTVTAGGFPSPALSESGVLPGGVFFHPGTRVLGGAVVGAGTGGIYHIIFAATNIVGVATQNFTLTVDEHPTFTSTNKTTFYTGSNGTFTVTTAGYPVATVSESGALPTGVTFNNGVFAGTPAAGTSGAYPITLTAANGLTPDATQNFTLTVNTRPPVAGTDTFGTATNTPLHIATTNLLANDSDPDGFSLSITAVSVSSTNHAPVKLSGGVVTYTPVHGFSGRDQFTYTLTDSNGGTAQGTVVVFVGVAIGAPPFNTIAVALNGTEFKLTFTGTPGQSYFVQSSATADGTYADVPPPITADPSGLVQYTNIITSLSNQFYRVRLGP